MLLSEAGVAAYLGLEIEEVRQLTHKGRLKAVRVGRKIRYRVADIDGGPSSD